MADATGVSVTVASMMMSGFSTFLPNLREVRRASPTDTTMQNDVRHGQLAASVLALGVGALMSWLSGSLTPLYVAFFAAGLYAIIYEMALRNNRG